MSTTNIPKIAENYAKEGISDEELAKDISNSATADRAQNIFGMFEVQTANEAIDEALQSPNPEYLYKPFILEGELSILFADTGIGKTVFAMHTAIEIARKGYITLFLDLELSKKQFQKRYTDDNNMPLAMPDNLYRVSFARKGSIPKDVSYHQYFLDSLRMIIERTNAQVVYLDNLTKLAANDTDSAKNAIPIIEELNRLKEEFGLTIIVLEHSKKTEANRPISLNDLQGSKMKPNLVDAVFSIGRNTADKNLRYLKQLKVRDGDVVYCGDEVLTCEISRKEGFLTFYPLDTHPESYHINQQSEDEKTQLAVMVKDLKAEGKTQEEIATQLGISQPKVSRILKGN